MKCPKCHYLSFDPEPRCKNCGYDLEVADADLAFRAAEDADQTLPDLTLRDEVPADEAPITLELVRSAKLVHLDDVVEERLACQETVILARHALAVVAHRNEGD